jgi:hypothetical protein
MISRYWDDYEGEYRVTIVDWLLKKVQDSAELRTTFTDR